MGRRTLAGLGGVAAVIVLAGCVPMPADEGAGTAQTAAPSSSATPSPSSPTPTPDPAPSTDPAPTPSPGPDAGAPGSGPVMILDGVPGSSWVSTLTCSYYTPTDIQLTSRSADTSGSLVGSVTLRDQGWVSVGILLTEGDRAYFQLEQEAPATVENDRLTLEFPVSAMSGDTSTVVLGVDCVARY